MTAIEVVIMNHLTRIINAILMYICHLLNADKSLNVDLVGLILTLLKMCLYRNLGQWIQCNGQQILE